MAEPQKTAPDQDLSLAVQLLQLGRMAEAEKLLATARERIGDRPDILHFLGVIAAERGNLAEAEQLWRLAIARDPREPLLHYNIGVVLQGQGREEQAIGHFRQALRLRETHWDAWLRLCGCYTDLGRFPAAEREGRRLAERLAQEPAASVDPQFVSMLRAARNGLGYALYRQGRYGEAQAAFDQALSGMSLQDPMRAGFLGNRALALSGQGRLEEAVADVQLALTLQPDNARLLNTLGHLNLMAGRAAEAATPLQRAVELMPDFAEARRNLAQARLLGGDLEGGAEMLRGLLATDPLDAAAAYDLSNLLVAQGDFQGAVSVLEPLLKARPDDPRALNNLALALRGLGHLEEAQKALRRALRSAPDEGLILTNLARVTSELGRPQEAVPLHRRAIARLPGDARPLGHAGATFLLLGDVDKAKAAWDAAIKLDPQNPDALAGLQKLQQAMPPAPAVQ